MKICNLFRSRVAVNPPSYTSSQIGHHAKTFINSLKGIKNTAELRGSKIYGMYKKTETYAAKLAKSAEKGNIRDTAKNLTKLHQHSDELFSALYSPFTSPAIQTAKVERLKISTVLWDNKLSLR